MSPNLLIYTASAGSGKTYRLVAHYISLAIREPRAFRHILCLTFTNKATAEMRDRILSATHDISQGLLPDLVQDVSSMTGFAPAQVQERAAVLRSTLLHDYGRFQVTTLDAFFQQVIRSFQQELHLGSGQRLEMDPSIAIDTVISELMESMASQPELERWLMDFTEFRIRNGYSWDVEEELRFMCRLLFSESYRQLLDNVQDLREYEEKCKATQHFYNTEIQRLRKEAEAIQAESIALLDTFGVSSDQLNGKTNTGYRFLLNFTEKWLEKPLEEQKSFMKLFLDPDTVAKPEVLGGQAGHAAFVSEFQRLSTRAVDFCRARRQQYNTLSLVSGTIFGSAILVELDRLLQAYRSRENVLFLPDATRILSGMLRTTDTPFFYERTGNAIHYLLLDEFQDTSWLQWYALKPLLENAMASHPHASLIVGDAKQAIYRWRNGDARLLLEVVPADFASQAACLTLQENWRSGKKIVAFNNQVFIHGVEIPAARFSDKFGEDPQLLRTTYPSWAVQTPKKSFDGFVGWYVPPGEAELPEGEEGQEIQETGRFVEDEVYRQVCRCIEAGFSESDIAILTLRKDHARRYAMVLSSMPYPGAHRRNLWVESQEGLKLETSERVGAMIAIAEWAAGYQHAEVIARCRLRLLSLRGHGNPAPQVPETESALRQWWEEEMKPILPVFGGSVADFLAEIGKACRIVSGGTDLYVSALLDHAVAFDRAGTGGLQAFVDLWYETGRDQWEIPPPDKAGGIRIMTFHKSKGLQFPVVILPHPDKLIIPYRNDVLLPVSVSGSSGLSLPFATIRMDGKSVQSDFRDQVIRERQMAFIDAWNEAYVAFTRPERALLVVSGRHPIMQPSGQAPGLIDLIGHATQACLQQLDIPADPAPGIWFEMGTLEPGPRSEEILDNRFEPVSMLQLGRPASVQLRSPDAPEEDTRFGELFHSILAMCRDADDLGRVARKLESEGAYPEQLLSDAMEKLKGMMALPEIEPLFRPGVRSMAEAGILMPGGRVIRPDRIVFLPDRCVVLECKTGKPDPSHHRQVRAYMEQVAVLESLPVTGLVVYTENMKVEVVQ